MWNGTNGWQGRQTLCTILATAHLYTSPCSPTPSCPSRADTAYVPAKQAVSDCTLQRPSRGQAAELSSVPRSVPDPSPRGGARTRLSRTAGSRRGSVRRRCAASRAGWSGRARARGTAAGTACFDRSAPVINPPTGEHVLGFVGDRHGRGSASGRGGTSAAHWSSFGGCAAATTRATPGAASMRRRRHGRGRARGQWAILVTSRSTVAVELRLLR